MGAYTILIFLSGLVILSYLFDVWARRIRIPSVLLLLFLGICLRVVSDRLGYSIQNTRVLLEICGTLGLILIVLEASLELRLVPEKLSLIGRSFSAALLLLVASSTVIALLLQRALSLPFTAALVNAIPLAVISSAVAIPGSMGLAPIKREFIVYESTRKQNSSWSWRHWFSSMRPGKCSTSPRSCWS